MNVLRVAAAVLVLATAAMVGRVLSDRTRPPAERGGPGRVASAQAPRITDIRWSGASSEPVTRRDWMSSAGRLQQLVRREPSFETEHALGVAYLRLDDYDAAIQTLHRALRLSSHEPSATSDLAAAFLVRGQALRRTEDIARALQLSSSALRREPTRSEALINRALSLDGLNLRQTADSVWQTVRQHAPDDRAAAIARLRATADLATFQHARPGVVVEPLDRLSPAQSRVALEEVYLPQWGREYIERVRDWPRLTDATVLLAQRVADGGDRSFLDEVTRIQAAAADVRRRTANGLAVLGDGFGLFRTFRYFEAAAKMNQAVALLDEADSFLVDRARLGAAAALRSARDMRATEQALAAIPDAASGCSLTRAGRMRLTGLLAIAEGNYAGAIESYTAANREFESCGEPETASALNAEIAEVFWALGALDVAWERVGEGLSASHRFPSVRERMALVFVGGELAQASGWLETAVAFFTEYASLARLSGIPSAEAEGVFAIARAQLALSSFDDANLTIAAGQRLLRSSSDAAFRDFVEGELAAVEAETKARNGHDDPVDVATRAMAYAERANRAGLTLGLRWARAMGYLRRGDLVDARQDLAAGVDVFESQLRFVPDRTLRLSFHDVGWRLYETLAYVDLLLGRDSNSVLATLDRGRARTNRNATLARAVAVPGRVRRPSIYIQPFHDRVVLWCMTPTSAQFFSQPLGAATVESLVAQLTDHIESGRDVSAEAEQLYDVLIRPCEPLIASSESADFIVAPPLDRLPWGVLRDRHNGLFLADRTVARVRLSLESMAPRRGSEPFTKAMVLTGVGANASPSRMYASLPAALAEARTVASLYRDAIVVDGFQASKRAVMSSLLEADVLHYSGHATVNFNDPHRSGLLLSDATSADAFLSGRDLAGLTTSLRLAVLTACKTGQAAATTGIGSLSIAQTFIASGTEAVIAALADLDDRWAQLFSEALHRHLSSGQSIERSMRLAQKEVRVLAERAGDSERAWALYTLLTAN